MNTLHENIQDLNLEYYVQFWVPHFKNYIEKLECVYRRPKKLRKGLENMSHEGQMGDLGFSLEDLRGTALISTTTPKEAEVRWGQTLLPHLK